MNRSINNEPEAGITELLRFRFKEDNDEGLYKRRQELAKWFTLVSPERSKRLHSRLVKEVTHDELSHLFWKLATATRLQMLDILEKKIGQHRSTSRKLITKHAAQTNAHTMRGSGEPRYIDNIIQRLQAPSLGGYFVEWEENKKTYTFDLPEKEIYRNMDKHLLEIRELYPDKRAALQAIRDVYANRPNLKGLALFTFYRGSHNIILPTIFAPDSTPKIIDAIEKADSKLERVVDEDLEVGKYIAQSFVNIFNPIPGTEVNDEGDLGISSNPEDFVLFKRGKKRVKPHRRWREPKYRNLRKRLTIIIDRYKFLRNRWIKGKHTANDYEEGFNAIVPKMARDLSKKRSKSMCLVNQAIILDRHPLRTD